MLQGGEWDHDGDYANYKMAISRSVDNGVTWSHHKLNDENGRIHTVAARPDNGNVIYAGGQETYSWHARLFKTEDGGANWTQPGGSVFTNLSSVNAIIIDPVTYDKLLVGTSQGVYISLDGGTSWNVPSLNTTVTAMTIDPTNPNNVFIGTYSGYYFSEDGGYTWTSHNAGLMDNAHITYLDYDAVNHMVYAGTETGGVYRLAYTSDVDDAPSIQPAHLVLHPNYPNPFNGSTVISYTLARDADVTLTICDIRGRTVATLLERFMTAGTGSVVWDGRDAAGNPLSSGVYLCRLQTQGNTDTQKLILRK